MHTGTTAWLVANGAALALIGAVVTAWARARPELRRRIATGGAAVAIAAALLLGWSRSLELPIGWITVLMEGGSIRNVQQLYGQGAHFGGGFRALGDVLAGHDVTTLPTVVRLNVGLAVLNTILFFLVAGAILRSWWTPFAFAFVYAFNPSTWHAAFSETPATIWATHLWLGCIAAAAVADERTTSGLRRLALAALGLLVCLAGLLRIELLTLGIPALAAGAAKALGWEPEVRRASHAVGRFVYSIVTGRVLVFALIAAALAALEFVSWRGNEIAWMIAALRPFNLSFLNLPWALAVSLPFGVVVLFVLGMVHTTRRWLDFLLLPVSFLLLFKIYWSASHGVYFERFRYLTFLTPAALFIALFGFRELTDWARRFAWPPWWERVAVLLIALSCTVWQLPGPKEIFRRRHELPGIATAEFLLGWNQQTEVRYLLDLVARHPSCVFVTKTAQGGAADGPAADRWAAFGAPMTSYREVLDAGESVDRIAEQLAPGAECVLFYRSLDCDLVRADGCAAETRGRTALEERVLENLPYSDITEYGAHHPVLRLGVYPVVQRLAVAE